MAFVVWETGLLRFPLHYLYLHQGLEFSVEVVAVRSLPTVPLEPLSFLLHTGMTWWDHTGTKRSSQQMEELLYRQASRQQGKAGEILAA